MIFLGKKNCDHDLRFLSSVMQSQADDSFEQTDGSANAGSIDGFENVWCCGISAKQAKPVKDELKARTWLDQTRKVIIVNSAGPDQTDGVCLFPLVASCNLDEIREKKGVFAASW
jgi:hypothetical protein